MTARAFHFHTSYLKSWNGQIAMRCPEHIPVLKINLTIGLVIYTVNCTFRVPGPLNTRGGSYSILTKQPKGIVLQHRQSDIPHFILTDSIFIACTTRITLQ